MSNTDTPLASQIQQLSNSYATLDERSRSFAASLVEQFHERGLSDKQAHWVGELLNRAGGAVPATFAVGSVKGVVDLLEHAKQRLKSPALLVRVNDISIRLNIAGPTAKVPGSVFRGTDGQRKWFGRISPDGDFEPRRSLDGETQTAIAAALVAMASDPAKAASEYGRLTGHCCFCSLPLTNERSTAVGYGKICARNWGLPW